MIDTHIDIGQIIVGSLLGIIIFLVKQFNSRLDKHETAITELVGHVQRLIGFQMGTEWNGNERRNKNEGY